MNHRVLAHVMWALSVVTMPSCGSGSPGDSADKSVDPVHPTSKDQSCTTNDDCDSKRCEQGTCAAPDAPSENGAKACNAHTDCTTGCGDDGKCATAASCTRAHGGRSCGPNGNDDCCAVAKEGAFTIDKYLVTAGRMRAFIERFEGNIQGFVATLPREKWDPDWNDAEAIPTDIASANIMLGPTKKKACNQGAYTGHTYWTPKADDDYSDFDQDTLDDKALNCVPWPLLQALCAFDGGHLAKLEELKAAFTNGGTTKYPWGDEALETLVAPDPKERLNIEASFKTTPFPATFRKNDNGEPAEVSFLVSPPGRYPNGNNKVGIADSAGNLLEWLGDQPRRFVWKADFEHHASNAAGFNGGSWWWDSPVAGVWGAGLLVGNAGLPNEKNGYYSIGGRCAY